MKHLIFIIAVILLLSASYPMLAVDRLEKVTFWYDDGLAVGWVKKIPEEYRLFCK